MKKYLLSFALVGVMALGTSTVYAGTPQKKEAPAKTEQTATVKKAAAKKTCTCGPKCDKKKCTKPCKCAKSANKKTTKPCCAKKGTKACEKKCAK